MTASADRALRVWSVPDGRLLEVIRLGHAHERLFSPDGHLSLRPAEGGRAKVSVRGFSTPPRDGSFASCRPTASRPPRSAPTGRWWSPARDGTVALWRVRDGASMHVLDGGKGPVTDAVFSPAATPRDDEHERRDARLVHGLWNAKRSPARPRQRGRPRVVQPRRTVPRHGRSRRHRTHLADEERRRGRVLRGLPTRRSPTPCSAPTETRSRPRAGRRGAALGRDRPPPARGSGKPVRTASFGPDGRLVVTAGDDGSARILTATDGSFGCFLIRPRSGRGVHARRQAGAHDDSKGVLRVWNTSTGTLVRSARDVSTGPLA